MARRLVIPLVVLALVLAAVSAALYHQKEQVLESLLIWGAQKQGIVLQNASVLAVSGRETTLGPIETNDKSLSISRAVLGYSIDGLLSGRLDNLIIEGLNVKGALGDDGVVIPVIESLPESGQPSTSPNISAFPIAEFQVSGMVALTGNFPVAVQFSLKGKSANSELRVSYKAAEDALTLGLQGEAVVRGDTIETKGSIELAGFDVSLVAPVLDGETVLQGGATFRTQGDLGGLLRGALSSQKLFLDQSELYLKEVNVGKFGGRDLRLNAQGSLDEKTFQSEFKVSGQLVGDLWSFGFKEAGFRAQAKGPLFPVHLKGRPFQYELGIERTKGKKLQVSGTFPDATATVDFQNIGSALTVTASFEGGTVLSDALPTNADLGFGRVKLAFAGDAPSGAFDIENIKLNWKKQTPLKMPSIVSGKGELDRGKLEVHGRVNQGEAVSLLFDVTHDLDGGDGGSHFTLIPLEFAPSGRQPSEFIEGLEQQLLSVGGKVTAKGEIAWGKKVSSKLEISLEDGEFHTAVAKFAGVNLGLEFNSLFPLSTPMGQTLTAAFIDVGLPFTNVAAVFHMTPGEKVVLEEMAWPFAGGVFNVEGATFDLKRQAHKLEIKVSGMELKDLADAINLEGLNGSGIISGTFPLNVKGGTLWVENALLESLGKGVLRYNAPEAGNALKAAGDNANLLVQALQNFHYDHLALKLNGDLAREVEVRVELAGRNPSLYDGYPLQLNFTISGALGDMIRKGMIGMEIPESLKRKLQLRHKD